MSKNVHVFGISIPIGLLYHMAWALLIIWDGQFPEPQLSNKLKFHAFIVREIILNVYYMKNFSLMGWFLLTVSSVITACSNSTEENVLTKSEIKLTSEIIPASRVTSLDYQSIQISEGQHVGVTLLGAQNEQKNASWVVSANGKLDNTGQTSYWGDTNLTIIAYHPYNAAWVGGDQNFSVSTDQSTNAGYSNSDLLWVSTLASFKDAPIGLKFTHKLAIIKVTLSSDDIANLSGATISICGTNISTGFNPTTGELFETEENIADIKAGVTEDNAYTASAIIIPQNVAKDTKFIKVTRDNKDFYYTLLKNKNYRSGYSYHYSLKLNETSMENPVIGEEIKW